MNPCIAIVDDDPLLRQAVAAYLRGQGLAVREFDGGRALREALAAEAIDLIVLDLVMPDEDGLSVLRWLRAASGPPVIMLTGVDETTDRVVGLELGADDYVAKPCDMRELLARIRSVLRRHDTSGPVAAVNAAPPGPPATAGWFGRWHLDRQRRRLVDSAGEVCALTGKEYALLAVFADHPNVVLSRDKLLDLSGAGADEVFDRAIDMRVKRLRQKIEPVPGDPTVIRTIRGDGGGYEYLPSSGPNYGR
ncbi:MAG TPA: response regulator transcription factor [Solimonas sp.]|nr:response regulator transcription factor [Solimonas sp.]